MASTSANVLLLMARV